MISRIHGEVVSRDVDRVEIATAGGVTYEVEVPLSVFQRLPREGSEITLRTVLVVRDDAHSLYGFIDEHERTLFAKVITATGVGPKLGLAMMSTYNASRLAQALAEKDVRALTQVSGVGKKKAEKIVLDLADKVQGLAVSAGQEVDVPGAKEAVAALVRLGYTFVDADAAIRAVIEADGPGTPEELTRAALARRTQA